MKLILLFFTVFSTLTLNAQDRVGNGGSAWVCWASDKKDFIVWIELLDLYEAREEYKLKIREYKENADAFYILRTMLKSYKDIFPQDFVKKTVEKLEQEILKNGLLEESERITHTSADLVNTDDLQDKKETDREKLVFRVRPKAYSTECPGPVTLEQLVNYKDDDKILVKGFFFNKIKENQRNLAATAFHESIYATLRTLFKESSSNNARLITGLVLAEAATTKTNTLKLEAEKVSKRIVEKSKVVRMQKAPLRFGTHDFIDEDKKRNSREPLPAVAVYRNPKTKEIIASYDKNSLGEAVIEIKNICPTCVEVYTQGSREPYQANCVARYTSVLDFNLGGDDYSDTRELAEIGASTACYNFMSKILQWENTDCVLLFSYCD